MSKGDSLLILSNYFVCLRILKKFDEAFTNIEEREKIGFPEVRLSIDEALLYYDMEDYEEFHKILLETKRIDSDDYNGEYQEQLNKMIKDAERILTEKP